MNNEENHQLKVVIIRHGDYDHSTGDLTPEGREKVRKTCRQIVEEFGENPVAFLLSSHKTRALQSMDVVKECFGFPAVATVNTRYYLYRANSQDHIHLRDELMALQKNGYKLCIITSHLEFVKEFSDYLLSDHWLKSPDHPQKGSYIVFEVPDEFLARERDDVKKRIIEKMYEPYFVVFGMTEKILDRHGALEEAKELESLKDLTSARYVQLREQIIQKLFPNRKR